MSEKASEQKKSDDQVVGPAVVEPFRPVEYWNPVYPNEQIAIRPRKLSDDHDAAGDPQIQFVAGYFRATLPQQVTILENDPKISHRIYKADMEKSIKCDKCGWTTKSSDAYRYHINQHG